MNIRNRFAYKLPEQEFLIQEENLERIDAIHERMKAVHELAKDIEAAVRHLAPQSKPSFETLDPHQHVAVRYEGRNHYNAWFPVPTPVLVKIPGYTAILVTFLAGWQILDFPEGTQLLSGDGNRYVMSIVASNVALGFPSKPTSTSVGPGAASPYPQNPTVFVANTDAVFTWGQNGSLQVNHVFLQNNTGAVVNFAFDALSTPGSQIVNAGQTLFLDISTQALHMQTNATPNINGSTSGNMVVLGYV